MNNMVKMQNQMMTMIDNSCKTSFKIKEKRELYKKLTIELDEFETAEQKIRMEFLNQSRGS